MPEIPSPGTSSPNYKGTPFSKNKKKTVSAQWPRGLVPSYQDLTRHFIPCMTKPNMLLKEQESCHTLDLLE